MPQLKAPKINTELAAEPRNYTKAWYGNLIASTDKILTERLSGSIAAYTDLLRDDQVHSTFQQRRAAITGAEWEVDPGTEDAASKKAADDLKEQLAAIEFDAITNKMLYGLWYGWAVGECLWGRDGSRIVLADVLVRRRERFRFDGAHGLHLITGAATVEQMPERKFWVFSAGASTSDEPYGLGLAHYAYWPVFFKRNTMRFWSVYLEKYGMPTATAKVSKSVADSATERDRVLEVLRAIQQDAAVVIPEGVEVALMEAVRSGGGSYDKMQEMMNAAISKVVLSQTMTTDNGSSRSQAEVHQDTQDAVVKGDADLICQSFNRGPARWLTEWNHPGATPPKVWRKTEPEDDQTKLAERDSKIYALGFEPTPELIEERYGPGWVKRGPAPAFGTDQPNPFQTPEEAKQFAELIDQFAAAKAGGRRDQAALAQAATSLAGQANTVFAERLRDLLALLDETGDLLTFRERINELIAAPPPEALVDSIHRSGFWARLLGNRRAQPPE